MENHERVEEYVEPIRSHDTAYIELPSMQQNIYQPLQSNGSREDDIQHGYEKIGQNQKKETKELKHQLRSVKMSLIIICAVLYY